MRAHRDFLSRHVSRRLLIAILLAAGPYFACGASLRAQEITFVVSAAQSKVAFTLGATLHTVHGAFQLTSGTVRVNPATGAISGAIVVDARSGQTENAGRDKKMHRDVLESDRFANIIFRPDHLEGKVTSSGVSSVQLHGVFRIHGAEHEMTLPVQAEMAGDHFTATVQFRVPYAEWGLKNPSNFFLRVSDTVEVSLQLTGRVSAFSSKPGM